MGIDCEKMLALRLTWLAAMTQAMFQAITEKGIKQGSNPSQLNYGVSVTDVDGKEGYELVVAGYDGPRPGWNPGAGSLPWRVGETASDVVQGGREEGGQLRSCGCHDKVRSTGSWRKS